MRDFERDSEADHTAADDDYVVTGIGHSAGRIRSARACIARRNIGSELVYDERHLSGLAGVGGRTRGGSGHDDCVCTGRSAGLAFASADACTAAGEESQRQQE